MGTEEIILSAQGLFLGAAATFLAILFWSMTRDTAWILVILGVILQYGKILHSIFEIFGLFPADIALIPGYLKVETLLMNLPLLFYGAAFVVMIRRTRR